MYEFTIFKACKVNIHPPKAPIIKEVIWTPPIQNWMKVNTDSAAVKNPDRAAAEGIFRDHNRVCSGCFAQFIGPGDALVAELHAAMIAVEVAVDKGYTNLWMESDSQLVILAFKSSSVCLGI